MLVYLDRGELSGAVTQVLTSLWYNDTAILAILGGGRTMMESPLIEAKTRRAWTRPQPRTASRPKTRIRLLECCDPKADATMRRVAVQIRPLD
jgi:hypothetical protein